VALTTGLRLGAYEIVSPLGAGGMGEVYKARDTRLDRIVAIKVLPSILASDPQLRERFDREARAISQLDHPHICTLYDVGEHEGTAFLVMQYLEGETLEQRLKKGALPLDQALRYAIQIADALNKAHRANIAHRDLKPGNIMLTKAGATLLDFGLAKTRASVGVQPGLSILPTAPTLTAEGTILGTIQYMAPEQLEGKDADARTDIFAFGAVLYEMLTGQRAFAGQSSANIIAAILERDPPVVSALQPLAPSTLDRLVKKCLTKDPDDRWQTARDLRDELQWIANDRPTESRRRSRLSRRVRRPEAVPGACARSRGA
jgi:eukaryotic-like serine/threonine-protein kinase